MIFLTDNINNMLKQNSRDTLDDYERFSTQIVIILLLSILIPAMITALTIGSQQPLVLIGPDQWINLKTVID
jgi:hypothetical protein